MARSRTEPSIDAEPARSVGRPRHFADDAERDLLIDAGYAALRDQGQEFTIAAILAEAGVSTRSFYRQFVSKDALLCAMYERDSVWLAERVQRRLADASSPVEAVGWWIDEMLGLTRHARRAERVAVFRSVAASRADGIAEETTRSRDRLVAPLRAAIEAGVRTQVFTSEDPSADADLVSAAVMFAAGLAVPASMPLRQHTRRVTGFCLQALGYVAP